MAPSDYSKQSAVDRGESLRLMGTGCHPDPATVMEKRAK